MLYAEGIERVKIYRLGVKMKVLVLGGGGREHAIVTALKRSPSVEKIFAAPGSDAIAKMAEKADVDANDVVAVADWAKKNTVDLTMVGPEAPLVDGIVDEFHRRGMAIVGPEKQAAMLEGSKAFAKHIMREAGVPTADFGEFQDLDFALEYIRNAKHKLVIKADGLAAGKGVIVCETAEEAEKAVTEMLVDRRFKEAGAKVVIEERLEGEEASLLALTDGKTIIPLPSSQDHKRVFDNDEGPNTGGMGAYSPAPVLTGKAYEEAVKKVIAPIVRSMANKGTLYKGILYAGLMMTDEGPKVLEYNCRFGDPETQPLLTRLTSDFGEALMACAQGRLDEIEMTWDDRAAVCIVLAAGGYPGSYEKGKKIEGIEEADAMDGVQVYHAGTRWNEDAWVTHGGRVLGVTALGETIQKAVDLAYKAAETITFEGRHMRKDIARRALDRV